MATDRDTETKQAVKNDIKVLQNRCVEAINIQTNNNRNCPLETYASPESVSKSALNYVQGLRTEIQNSSTPISSDGNLLTAQFLHELKERTSQVKELVAYVKGNIYDVDYEIERLKGQIKIAEEAKSRPLTQRTSVQPAHVAAAKEKFHLMKTELHGLIASLFPDKKEVVMKIMGELMAAKLQEGSPGYIPVTPENYAVVQLLKKSNVVVSNPYDDKEVKLAM